MAEWQSMDYSERVTTVLDYACKNACKNNGVWQDCRDDLEEAVCGQCLTAYWTYFN